MADPYARAMNNRCPHCGQGTLFDGWFSIAPRCGVCGARYERYEGVWTGPTVIAYGIGGALGVAMGFALVVSGNYFPHAEVVIALIACASIAVMYRFIKAWWMGWLYAGGYIFPDKPRIDAPISEEKPPP